MTDWRLGLGLVAGCIYFLGFVPYLITIYQGKTRPNRASWWIWSVVGLILVFSYESSSSDSISSLWVPAAAAVCHLIIALASIKYGEGGWNRFDRACLAAAGLSLILWWAFDAPLIALFTNLAIDFSGALPTIRKTYLRPDSEDVLPWFLFWLASLLNLFAIEQFSIALFAYPFYLFCIPTIILYLLMSPKFKLRTVNTRSDKYKSFNREL
ncbi:MAG: hypothetical protein F6K04_08375 [Leptolyngbya sp. SIO4C5]|uniref:hypothetical protein n=1 Tax=Sphaerothrix gracilis TaxID=3151835 RepID=UPI0013C1B68B|nr:hypothetical protein [Leptolyngbya sp. SIO4C5]